MKIIDVSQISDPNVQQPFTGLSLAFLQNATMEVLNALAQALSNRYGGTGSDKYVLWGLEKGGTVGAYTFTEGWFYDQTTAQIYYCAGNGGIASANPYLNLAVDNGAANIFSDGSTKYVNKDYTAFMSTISHSPICQFNDLLFNFIPVVVTPVWKEVGVDVSFQNSWTNDGQYLKFIKDNYGNVTITGYCANTSNINTVVFALPSGYLPSKQVFFSTAQVGSVDTLFSGYIDHTTGQVAVASSSSTTNKAIVFTVMFTTL